jgi:hypothetical protein
MADFANSSEPDEDFQVLPWNVTAVKAFLALQSQWRWASLSTMGEARILRTGLAYEAIETTCRLRRIELGPDDFERIQVMEAAALTAWSEEARG